MREIRTSGSMRGLRVVLCHRAPPYSTSLAPLTYTRNRAATIGSGPFPQASEDP